MKNLEITLFFYINTFLEEACSEYNLGIKALKISTRFLRFK